MWWHTCSLSYSKVWEKITRFDPLGNLAKLCLHIHACTEVYTHTHTGSRQIELYTGFTSFCLCGQISLLLECCGLTHFSYSLSLSFLKSLGLHKYFPEFPGYFPPMNFHGTLYISLSENTFFFIFCAFLLIWVNFYLCHFEKIRIRTFLEQFSTCLQA